MFSSLLRSNKAAGNTNLFCSQSLVSGEHPHAYAGRAEVLYTLLDVLLKQVLDTGGAK
jgi:hypothetical protein